MLSNYIEQLFKLDNYYDGLIVTDNKGYIEFFMTYRPDISGAKQEDLVGKHVLDIYPGLTEETSTIMRVLRSGEPIYNEYQTLITCREEVFQSVNTTMPIRAGGTGEIIGAIDVSRYASRFYEKQSINLHSAHTRKGPFYCVDDIITCSEDMEAIKRKIPLISKTDSTVLITGRSGTGKELIAQSIHTSSNRADKAFVSQNCAAIPATLLESILFGTTKGSYTGAENKPGLFEIANGGTLFLDEINSMDISVQPKLLRAIEEKRVCRLGSYKPLEVDVKIVAAMNEDPQECVRKGKLREDLLYRLSVVRVDMPTLQERRCDIELLMKYFISKFNSSMKKDIFGVDEEVKKINLGVDTTISPGKISMQQWSMLFETNSNTQSAVLAEAIKSLCYQWKIGEDSYLIKVEKEIADLQQKLDDTVCAVMLEYIQGEGGVNALDQAFVDAIYQLCAEKDVLVITDEVQTGVGRTGTFLAGEQFGHKADVVTLAKGIAGGLPMGACLASEKCSEVLDKGSHGSTFGGNPVCCAGGLAVLETVTAPGFLEEVQKKADYLRAALSKMKGVASVSGLGMMIGIALKNQKAADVASAALQKGLLVLTAKDKVRLLPPLTISYEEMDQGLAILQSILDA